MIANAMPSIVHTPAASPSTPSEKLTTFIRPTSQIALRTPPACGNCSAPTNGSVMSVTTAPPSTAMIAAAICPASLTIGFRSRASSTAPTRAISAAPARIAQVWTSPAEPARAWGERASRMSAGIQIAVATSTAARMASPPSSGVVRVARPRSDGMASAPTRRATRPASGVSRAETASAAANAKTASQYRMACRIMALGVDRTGAAGAPARSHASGEGGGAELRVQRMALGERCGPLGQLALDRRRSQRRSAPRR